MTKITNKEIGLDLQFCEKLLEDTKSKINSVIKGAVAEFYSTAFLDKAPLKRVCKLQTNCFDFESISSLSLSDFPIKWINAESSFSDKLNDVHDYFKVNLIIHNLMVEAFTTLP